MNILHIVNISFVIPYFLGNQLNWFVEKGNKEYIVCSDSEELKKFSKQYNFGYRAIDVLRKISIYKDLKAVVATYKYIKEVKADVVTGHTPKGGLVAMLAASRVPIRIYLRHGLVYETSHGLKRSLLVNIDRLASRLATKIVCVSPSVAKRSLDDKLNSASKQVVLANGTCNGIDMDAEFFQLLDKLDIQDGCIPTVLKYYESDDAKTLTKKICSIPAFQGILSPMVLNRFGMYEPDFCSRYFYRRFRLWT